PRLRNPNGAVGNALCGAAFGRLAARYFDERSPETLPPLGPVTSAKPPKTNCLMSRAATGGYIEKAKTPRARRGLRLVGLMALRSAGLTSKIMRKCDKRPACSFRLPSDTITTMKRITRVCTLALSIGLIGVATARAQYGGGGGFGGA